MNKWNDEIRNEFIDAHLKMRMFTNELIYLIEEIKNIIELEMKKNLNNNHPIKDFLNRSKRNGHDYLQEKKLLETGLYNVLSPENLSRNSDIAKKSTNFAKGVPALVKKLLQLHPFLSRNYEYKNICIKISKLSEKEAEYLKNFDVKIQNLNR